MNRAYSVSKNSHRTRYGVPFSTMPTNKVILTSSVLRSNRVPSPKVSWEKTRTAASSCSRTKPIQGCKSRFGGHDSFRDPQEIDAESFIGIKSFKAKGKRLTTFDTATITELEPIRRPNRKPKKPWRRNGRKRHRKGESGSGCR